MAEPWIAAVVGDIGSVNEILPAMKLIKDTEVRWFVDPGELARADIILEREKISFEKRLPQPSDAPSVIVVGTSATAC
jgi:hypothetical protein